jgi:hypothetical protein
MAGLLLWLQPMQYPHRAGVLLLARLGTLAVVSAATVVACGGRALSIDSDGGVDLADGQSPNPDGGFLDDAPGAADVQRPPPSPPSPPFPPTPPPTCDPSTPDSGPADICVPACAVTYTKSWRPPHPHQAACTQANIDLFRQVCLGTQADGGAACKSLTATVAGKACEECILPSTGTELGALIATGGYISPNIAGCIAIEQNTVADGAGCASASLYLSECRAVACGACAKDANTTTDMINACDTAADTGACLAESTAAKCLDQLADGGPGSQCLVGTDFDTTYSAIVPIFCLAP